MIDAWIRKAGSNEPVWLCDVRSELQKDETSVKVFMRLDLCDGSVRNFRLPIPKYEGDEELCFVREYICASVYNVLAAFSGQKLTFYIPEGEPAAEELLRELPERFQLNTKPRNGFGKTINVADRMCRAFGLVPFSFEYKIGSPCDQPEIPEKSGDLGEKLRNLLPKAMKGTYCGADVGGTDVKLAISKDGELISVKVLDWNPAASPDAEGLIGPLESFIKDCMEQAGILSLDGIGVSFPDVVINNRIVGGETPKTKGMREHSKDYEAEFSKVSKLGQRLALLCSPGAPVRITNDGNIAAFTAAMELAFSSDASDIQGGVIAHSIGTDLGTGWIEADGSIPPLPMELYDFLLDLGSFQSREFPPDDLRCVCNANSGLPGVRRYVGQSAAFRLAWDTEPSLLDGFTVEANGIISVQESPKDLRKPCLEHLMEAAENGDPDAEDIFRQIGRNLGIIAGEMDYLWENTPESRILFGRFIKIPRCFELLKEGASQTAPGIRLIAADDELACTPLMKQLSNMPDETVAQYGQAVGSIYFALT